MACVFICDNCGVKTSAALAMFVGWAKPRTWFQHVEVNEAEGERPEVARTLDACSEKCKNELALKHGISAKIEKPDESPLELA